MAIRLVIAAYPRLVNARIWPICADLLPHALEVTRQTESLTVAPVETIKLLNWVGEYFMQLARYNEAEDVLQRALRIAESTFGPNHHQLSSTLASLGALRAEQGDLTKAQAHFERDMKIGKRSLGSVWNTPSRLNNLGHVLMKKGKFVEAPACFEQALHMTEQGQGRNSVHVATIADNLGLLLQDIGDLKGGTNEH